MNPYTEDNLVQKTTAEYLVGTLGWDECVYAMQEVFEKVKGPNGRFAGVASNTGSGGTCSVSLISNTSISVTVSPGARFTVVAAILFRQ